MAWIGREVMSLVVVLMVMAWGGAQAQSSGCTNAIMGLASCLNYVTGNSSTPSSSCCSQLSSVVQQQPRCLCSLLNGNAPNIGVSINQTLAIALPGACNVQTPPISQCNAVANGPTRSAPSPASSTEPPKEAPEAQSPAAPSTPSVPSESGSGTGSGSGAGSGSGTGSGSKAVPSTDTNASDGSNFGAPAYLLLFLLFIGTRF